MNKVRTTTLTILLILLGGCTYNDLVDYGSVNDLPPLQNSSVGTHMQKQFIAYGERVCPAGPNRNQCVEEKARRRWFMLICTDPGRAAQAFTDACAEAE